ncbi:hypothetical protein [Lachnospira eligens]|uniref:hypothetical protein n=1 Tax=Lachnospira eligens TaxID=39485 RepID=UPI00189AFFD6|nr:hypothetical protein [Lachnospira eligens]
MNDNYTQYNSDSIYKFLDEDDASEAIDFIKDPSNFRTFNEGLSEIMIKKGYISDSTAPDEISQILYKKLTDIGSSLSLNTISSWIKGDHRPKVEAGYRKNIYEICYALNLTFNETIWFFHHVYYDRAFNCHTIDESVYYYCLKNNIAYKDSLDIIKEIENSPDITSSYEETSNYTLFIQKTIDKIESVDELITFLTLNKANFKSWNASAYKTLDDLVKDLLPSENGKKEIEKIKRKIKATHSIYGIIPKKNNQNEWGLIMQEFFYDLTDESYLDILDGKNIRSKNFLLEQILGMKLITDKEKKRFIDKASIPDIVKNNFPSRKTMSDVLSEDKITQSKSYDSIRKLIILLEFYRYWCSIKIMDEEYDDFENPLSDAFIDEINYTLYLCGYEEMYAGNPYDWIFMCSAQADDPLSYFRQCITFILDE